MATSKVVRGHRAEWLGKRAFRKEFGNTKMVSARPKFGINWRAKFRMSKCTHCTEFEMSKSSIAHMENECPRVARYQYKLQRYDKVAKVLYCKLYEKVGSRERWDVLWAQINVRPVKSHGIYSSKYIRFSVITNWTLW